MLVAGSAIPAQPLLQFSLDKRVSKINVMELIQFAYSIYTRGFLS